VGPGCKGCACRDFFRGGKARVPPERVFTDVQVLSEGSPPRVPLRVVRSTGFRYRFTVLTGGASGIEGQPLAPAPLVAMTLDHEVLRGSADPIVVQSDGGITRMIEERIVLSNIVVRHDLMSPPVVLGWNAAVAPLIGTSLLQNVAESGAVPTLRMELLGGAQPPEAVSKALNAGLETQRHFPFRLPDTAVGVGARWRFSEPLTLNGAAATQAAEMVVKAIDADTVVIGIVVRQEAPRQEVPHPFEPGHRAVLEQLRGDATGEVTLDRRTALPRRSQLSGVTRFTLSGEVQGQPGSLTVLSTTIFSGNGAPLDDTDAGGLVPH
jgi:hypothetical protein